MNELTRTSPATLRRRTQISPDTVELEFRRRFLLIYGEESPETAVKSRNPVHPLPCSVLTVDVRKNLPPCSWRHVLNSPRVLSPHNWSENGRFGLIHSRRSLGGSERQTKTLTGTSSRHGDLGVFVCYHGAFSVPSISPWDQNTSVLRVFHCFPSSSVPRKECRSIPSLKLLCNRTHSRGILA